MKRLIPLPDQVHLRLQGPDAEKYLNGQVTQQVVALPEGESRYSFVCDVKGRILFDAAIRRDETGFLISIEGIDKDEALARLDRYLIADDCELSDETEKWHLFHELDVDSQEKGLINRFGTPGQDLYFTAEQAEAFNPESLFLTNAEEQEDYRLQKSVPRLSDLKGAFPAETGLEEDTVSFHKGCYLGQEVISRIKRAGKTNRKLVPVRLSESVASCPCLFSSAEASKPLLEVTSCGREKQEESFPALGYLSSRYDGEAALTSADGIVATLLA